MFLFFQFVDASDEGVTLVAGSTENKTVEEAVVNEDNEDSSVAKNEDESNA